MTTRSLSSRTGWHTAVGAVVVGWLVTATVVGVRGLLDPVEPWLPIHLLLLGAVSNAILVWSTYFTEALLRQPRTTTRRNEAIRIAVFNLGAVTVVAGMTWDALRPIVLGAGLAFVAVVWHGVVLLARIRRSLPSRFGATVRYYVAASALLPLGVCLGVVMASKDLDDDVHARVALAHVTLNVLGWMGLTVLGTLVTLWPTMLHTQVADGAERASRRALPVLVVGIGSTAALSLLGSQVLTALSLGCYLIGLVIALRPLVTEAVRRRPSTYATWSVGLGVLWYAASLVALTAIVARAPNWTDAAEAADHLGVAFLVGFGAQILLGALSYLVPVVLGGGPAMARRTIAILDTGARTRLVVINAALLASLLPLPSAALAVVRFVGLGTLVCFLPLVARAALTRRATRGDTARVLP